MYSKCIPSALECIPNLLPVHLLPNTPKLKPELGILIIKKHLGGFIKKWFPSFRSSSSGSSKSANKTAVCSPRPFNKSSMIAHASGPNFLLIKAIETCHAQPDLLLFQISDTATFWDLFGSR